MQGIYSSRLPISYVRLFTSLRSCCWSAVCSPHLLPSALSIQSNSLLHLRTSPAEPRAADLLSVVPTCFRVYSRIKPNSLLRISSYQLSLELQLTCHSQSTPVSEYTFGPSAAKPTTRMSQAELLQSLIVFLTYNH